MKPVVVVLSTCTSLIPLFLSLLLVIPHSLILAEVTFQRTMCSNTSNYAVDSQFAINLNRLLFRSLYNDAGDSIFSNVTQGDDPDKAYGLFLCRGDVQPSVCQICIDKATDHILKQCPLKKEAIIWYDECLIRYSNRSFFSNLEIRPSFFIGNIQNVTEPDKFHQILRNTFSNLINVATSNPSNRMYATSAGEINATSSMKLDSMVQCTPDLSPTDCGTCLNYAVSILLKVLNGSQGGRTLTPSCNIRYERYSFFRDPLAQPGREERKRKTIAISVSVSALLVVALLAACIYYQRRRKITEKEDRNSSKVELVDLAGASFGNDYSSQNLQGEKHAKLEDFPSIPLDIILVATQHFSEENKLGQGGFGPVYKGTLSNGKEIAVKRLSKTSGQGLKELKNEVTLIARLQHRNLVRLLGCCLEGHESLLIYEYMPNKSLDVFLFDSTRGEQLDWKRRLLIINGIARGLQYLHEDSRLRIIHRDLKVSNILLDREMNPKISDFGMAKIFGRNQSEANTNRVVGTYGYMAPEYAMKGLFSVKSDVFSFGVLLLEIISGKKNNGFYHSEHGHSLLTFAWKLWLEGNGLELMDPLLVQSSMVIEVMKCIHIGLLCVQEDAADRPTMSSVIIMLGSDSVTLPQPRQPAFSVGRQVLKLAQCSANPNVLSINEITISEISPR